METPAQLEHSVLGTQDSGTGLGLVMDKIIQDTKAVEQQHEIEEQAQNSYGRNYEEVIQRYPVNRPVEEVSDSNFMRDIHNHILLSNNRVSNVKDGEDAVDLSFSPTLIVPLKVNDSNVYKTRTVRFRVRN